MTEIIIDYDKDQLSYALANALKERDDALSQIAQAECRAERFCQERDELIEENKKLNKEVDDLIRQRPLLIEDFKRERDEARNASSDNKVSKPNPLKPFYKY